jgi:hypothetical protein
VVERCFGFHDGLPSDVTVFGEAAALTTAWKNSKLRVRKYIVVPSAMFWNNVLTI